MQFQITDFLKIKQRHIESTGLGFLHKVHQYLSPHGLSPRSCRLVKICIPLENMDRMHPVNKQVLSYHLNRQQNMRKEKSPMIQYLKLDLKIQSWSRLQRRSITNKAETSENSLDYPVTKPLLFSPVC